MIKILLRILLTAVALIIIAHIVPGISITSLYTAFLVAVVWGLITLFVRPVLRLLTLPITLLTLGLFSFVLNALLFWLVSVLVPGFTVSGFIPALEGSVLLAIVSAVLHSLL